MQASQLQVTGSIKFDINVAEGIGESAERLREKFGQDRLIWIAGSTREGEEERLLNVYKTLKKEFTSLLLLIVPRHPERFDLVARKIMTAQGEGRSRRYELNLCA